MKNNFFRTMCAIVVAVAMTSCYSLSYTVGNGAQSGEEVKGHNHYLIEGLVQVGNASTPTDLAGGAKDYDVKIVHTFVDGLLAAITGGLYAPTTVIVKK
jgi:hypothetical protein